VNRERCDVLIVGGGPAGSSCARVLHAAGLDVLVLDKSRFPRDKVCAGWITPPVLDELWIDRADYAQERVLQPITGFRLGLIGAAPLDNDYGRVVSYGIRRCEFDQYLLQRSGARLSLGEALHSIERRAGGWLINQRIEAALLIGAGGHFCPVARYLGADVGRSELSVMAREIEFPMSDAQQRSCRVEPQRPELYFCADLKGYGWVFHKGAYLNIGLGREDPQRLAEHSAAFLDWLKTTDRIPADSPAELHGHAYLLYGHSRRKLLDDGVMLIGDAAGLAYAQSGEGIRPAIESGLLAAASVLAARGDYSSVGLAGYRDSLTRRFGSTGTAKPQPITAALRNYLGTRLLRKRWFTRHVVLDRWFLHRHQSLMQ
jgi:menaquinone-9 beta-reductase